MGEDNKEPVVPRLDNQEVAGCSVDIAAEHTDLGHTMPVQRLLDLEHG